MTLWRFLLSVLLLLAAGLNASSGQAAGSVAAPMTAAKGLTLARAWCAGCHAVEPGAAAPFADIPTFAAVAHMPSTTASSLHAFLSTPHGDMPDIKLKSGELEAVVAYILSLKGKATTD